MPTNMSQVVDSIESARSAAARYAWREAYDVYALVDRSELGPDDLERYAESAWWCGKLDEAIALRELSYNGYSKGGDALSAARVALTLSWDHSGRGAFAVSQGWFARAVTEMFSGELASALERFSAAEEQGRVFGDRDIEVLAQTGRGRVLVKMGRVEEGLALMDESSAAAVCGELSPHTTGLVYCLTISAFHDVGDYRRAAEWTDAANKWCDRLDVSGFPGACRVHRAEIMRLRGDLVGAERQAIEAVEE